MSLGKLVFLKYYVCRKLVWLFFPSSISTCNLLSIDPMAYKKLSMLELQKSALDKHVFANFVKGLRRRRIVFLTLKSVIYLAILICAWLFLSGVLGDIFLLFLGTLLSLFILNADYQLQK